MFKLKLTSASFFLLFGLTSSLYAQLSLERLKNLPAIHTTDFLPPDGILKAGALNRAGEHVDFSFRTTVHFSIGEMVRPHSGGNWEGKKYAFITRMEDISEQLVNVNPYDSFVLGDFDIVNRNHKTVLLAPEGDRTAAEIGYAHKIEIEYYSRDKPLRQAIDETITQRGMESVEMVGDARAGLVANLADGTDINRLEVWEPFLRSYPNLAMGTHTDSIVGSGYIFGATDQIARELMEAMKDPGKLDTGTLEIYIVILEDYMAKMKAIAPTKGSSAVNTVVTASSRISPYLKWYKLELEARVIGKTLFSDDFNTTIRTANELVSSMYSGSQDEIQNIIKANSSSLGSYVAACCDNSKYNPALMVSNLSDTDVDDMLSKAPIYRSSIDMDQFNLYRYIQKYLVEDMPDTERQLVASKIDDLSVKFLQEKRTTNLFGWFLSQIVDDATSYARVQELIERPLFAGALYSYTNISSSSSGDLLASVFRQVDRLSGLAELREYFLDFPYEYQTAIKNSGHQMWDERVLHSLADAWNYTVSLSANELSSLNSQVKSFISYAKSLENVNLPTGLKFRPGSHSNSQLCSVAIGSIISAATP